MEDFGLYIIITKPKIPHIKIAEICVSYGIKMLQLREKHIPDKEIVKIGKQIRSITKGTKTNFVINDRPDIAVICEADYLHLGQDDIPIEEARKIVGEMKIGLSTHTIEQAKAALSKNPAYIGFGPIFPTYTKENPDDPVGTEQLKTVLEIANVPVVALGGISADNICKVIDAGAKNFALVSYLMQTEDFETRLKNIINLLKKEK